MNYSNKSNFCNKLTLNNVKKFLHSSKNLMENTTEEVTTELAGHFGVESELFMGYRDYLGGTLESLLRLIRNDYYTYVDEVTGKTVTEYKYFYTQPERDFDAEQSFRDYRTLTISFVSNPNYIQDTYNFFKTKKCSAGKFIRDYDMLNIKKRKLSVVQEEYEKARQSLEEENKGIVEELSKKDYSSLSKRERKIINGHYRNLFTIQRLEYYNRIMDNIFDFIKN